MAIEYRREIEIDGQQYVIALMHSRVTKDSKNVRCVGSVYRKLATEEIIKSHSIEQKLAYFDCEEESIICYMRAWVDYRSEEQLKAATDDIMASMIEHARICRFINPVDKH